MTFWLVAVGLEVVPSVSPIPESYIGVPSGLYFMFPSASYAWTGNIGAHDLATLNGLDASPTPSWTPFWVVLE